MPLDLTGLEDLAALVAKHNPPDPVAGSQPPAEALTGSQTTLEVAVPPKIAQAPAEDPAPADPAPGKLYLSPKGTLAGARIVEANAVAQYERMFDAFDAEDAGDAEELRKAQEARKARQEEWDQKVHDDGSFDVDLPEPGTVTDEGHVRWTPHRDRTPPKPVEVSPEEIAAFTDELFEAFGLAPDGEPLEAAPAAVESEEIRAAPVVGFDDSDDLVDSAPQPVVEATVPTEVQPKPEPPVTPENLPAPSINKVVKAPPTVAATPVEEPESPLERIARLWRPEYEENPRLYRQLLANWPEDWDSPSIPLFRNLRAIRNPVAKVVCTLFSKNGAELREAILTPPYLQSRPSALDNPVGSKRWQIALYMEFCHNIIARHRVLAEIEDPDEAVGRMVADFLSPWGEAIAGSQNILPLWDLEAWEQIAAMVHNMAATIWTILGGGPKRLPLKELVVHAGVIGPRAKTTYWTSGRRRQNSPVHSIRKSRVELAPNIRSRLMLAVENAYYWSDTVAKRERSVRLKLQSGESVPRKDPAPAITWLRAYWVPAEAPSGHAADSIWARISLAKLLPQTSDKPWANRNHLDRAYVHPFPHGVPWEIAVQSKVHSTFLDKIVTLQIHLTNLEYLEFPKRSSKDAEPSVDLRPVWRRFKQIGAPAVRASRTSVVPVLDDVLAGARWTDLTPIGLFSASPESVEGFQEDLREAVSEYTLEGVSAWYDANLEEALALHSQVIGCWLWDCTPEECLEYWVARGCPPIDSNPFEPPGAERSNHKMFYGVEAFAETVKAEARYNSRFRSDKYPRIRVKGEYAGSQLRAGSRKAIGTAAEGKPWRLVPILTNWPEKVRSLFLHHAGVLPPLVEFERPESFNDKWLEEFRQTIIFHRKNKAKYAPDRKRPKVKKREKKA